MSDYPVVHIPGMPGRKKLKSSYHARSVMLDDDRYEYLLEAGDGNYSEGVRRCIDEHREKHAKPIDVPDSE